jgi:hypothetical protein
MKAELPLPLKAFLSFKKQTVKSVNDVLVALSNYSSSQKQILTIKRHRKSEVDHRTDAISPHCPNLVTKSG